MRTSKWEPTAQELQQLDMLGFADQLANRQATRTPNWQSFYAGRAELEQRIRDRDDG